VDSSRRTQLVPSGDPTLPPVSITNYGDTESTDFGGGVNFSYLFTPSASFGLGGYYNEQNFKQTEVGGDELEDSSQVLGRATASYQVSPRTQVGLLGSAGRQKFSQSPGAETYTGELTYSYSFSEVLRLNVAAGISYVRQESVPGRYSEKDTSPAGGFNLIYSDKTFSATLYGSYVYSGTSGYGEVTRQGTVGFALTDHFTRDWTWGLSGTFQNNQSALTEDAVDTNTIFASGNLRYRFWEWGSLYLTVKYEHQESNGRSGSDLNSYSALLGFTVSRPYNLF
jgi:hypothetical protein